ncbi:MAG: DUF4867 family protein [Lachnospiraceae bacterium]|nr:DUF4867 family protein [Lachnospiraceae bacterium]
MLQRLNEVNDILIHSVDEEIFKTYGRIVRGYDFSDLISYMEKETAIPEDGNVYVASVPDMEKLPVKDDIQAVLYGGMPIQIGYCNGRNTTYNGFEYHKGSEINVAVTDFMLVLGHSWEIRDNHFDNKDACAFFVPKGCAIEMYQTTLHLSPLRVTDRGFKGIVILPRGTNTPLTEEERERNAAGKADAAGSGRMENPDLAANTDLEGQLLLQRNKWVIAHPDREPLIRQGAFPGIIGENKELKY